MNRHGGAGTLLEGRAIIVRRSTWSCDDEIRAYLGACDDEVACYRRFCDREIVEIARHWSP